MTDNEIFSQSTKEEILAAENWKALQENAKLKGYMTEGEFVPFL